MDTNRKIRSQNIPISDDTVPYIRDPKNYIIKF